LCFGCARRPLYPHHVGSLSEKLKTVKRPRPRKISERNIEDAAREVRLALLEADVQLTSRFTERVDPLARPGGPASLTPEQHFIKIVTPVPPT
jgi:signal recognition particle GTPase